LFEKVQTPNSPPLPSFSIESVPPLSVQFFDAGLAVCGFGVLFAAVDAAGAAVAAGACLVLAGGCLLSGVVGAALCAEAELAIAITTAQSERKIPVRAGSIITIESFIV
jgi:hypothetical protein